MPFIKAIISFNTSQTEQSNIFVFHSLSMSERGSSYKQMYGVNLRTHLSCLFLEAKALCSSSIMQLGGIGGCIILPRCGDPEELARGPRSGRVIEAKLSVALGGGSLGR